MQIDKEEIFELLKERIEEGHYKDYFLERTVKVLAIMNKRMQLPEKVCEVSKILVEVYLVGADDMDRCYDKLLKNAPEYKKTPEN